MSTEFLEDEKRGPGRPAKETERMSFSIAKVLTKELKSRAGNKYGEQTAIVERALAREFGIDWPPRPDQG